MINASRIMVTLFGCVALLAGCTPENPVGTVKGTASLKGKPYNAAAVMFISLEKGVGSGGDLQSDGSYSLTEPLPVGQYTVYFTLSTLRPSRFLLKTHRPHQCRCMSTSRFLASTGVNPALTLRSK